MKPITLRLPEPLLDELDTETDENDSRSEYIRSLLRERGEDSELVGELRDRVDDLERERADLLEEIDELEQTAERLENEKRLILEEREERQELVAFAESERDLARRREQREREREQAGVVTRAKWTLFGRSFDDEQD